MTIHKGCQIVIFWQPLVANAIARTRTAFSKIGEGGPHGVPRNERSRVLGVRDGGG